MTLAESQRVLNTQNTTMKLMETASKDAYSYALAVALCLGGILCLLNAILLLYLCRRQATSAAKQANGADQTVTHSEISRTGSELDFFTGSVDSPRRSANYSGGSSLPRGGRRTLLLQQREPGSAAESRRFSSSSDGRYVSAPRPDISAEVVPLTSEMSPMRPGSSMSTATIRFRPSGAATTARCHGHHRQQQQQQPHQQQQQQQQRSQHHHHHREERMSLTIVHNDGSPPDTIRPEQIPAPAPFSQNSPDENPSTFRSGNFQNQIR